MVRKSMLVVLVSAVACAGMAHGTMLKPKKPEVVASPVDDRAGYDADRELDFRQLEVEGTAEHLLLRIEFWTAWEELDSRHEYEVAVDVAKPGSKLFLPYAYGVMLEEDGSLETNYGEISGTFVAEHKKHAWTPTEDLVDAIEATLEGTLLTIQIPWEALPYEDLWVQVGALHRVLETDEKDEHHVGGSVRPLSNDLVPNKMKVVAVSRPR